MRKNSPRKWLHAILDLLPLFIIPIFAIYSRNENYQSSVEINYGQEEILNFSQIYKGKDFSQFGLISTFNTETGLYSITGTGQNNGPYLGQAVGVSDGRIGWYLEKNHQYYVRSNYSYADGIRIQTIRDGIYASNTVNTIWSYNNDFQIGYANCWFFGTRDVVYDIADLYINVFDLTAIYGLGNEPTKEEFDNLFTQIYYAYGIEEVVTVPYSVTLNDTDVGSQFVYTLYNSVDKYFNVSKTFNLDGVYSWLSTNIFNGSVPLGVYVVWNVIVYEFVIDILFILYAFFMFLIDFTEYVLEKPFNKVTRC